MLFSLVIAGISGGTHDFTHSFTSDVLAAGSALGFAITDFDWVLYVVLIASVVGMTLIQQFMMPRLREIL